MDNKFLRYMKNGRKWIYLLVVFILIVGASSFVYFYFRIYPPNFSDVSVNFISSDSSGSLKPGDRITYTVNYGNTGWKAAENFEIILKIPDNTFFISSENNVVSQNTDGTLTIKIGNVEGTKQGTADLVVGVKKPLDNGTLIKFDGAKFTYKNSGKILNNDIEANLISTVESSPDFSNFGIDAIDENGGVLRQGDVIQYRLIVKNSGGMNAADVEVKSNFSEFTDVIEDSITDAGTYGNSSVSWNIDNLEVNKPEILSFRVRVKNDLTEDVTITNNSTLIYGTDITERSVEEEIKRFSDLTTSEAFIYDENGGYLWATEIINVKVVLKNTGDKTEESYRLICPTPAGATYISQSGTPEGISWSDDIRGLIWDLKNLGVGEEKEISFRIKVNEDLVNSGGIITTAFKIESSNGEVILPSKSMKVRGHVIMNIVAMGDSLIEMTGWVQMFDDLLEANYPYADYNTIASGKGGEKASGGSARFDSTVAIYNPQIVIVAYGSNDAGPRVSGFQANMESIVAKAKNLGARVFINLIGPIYWPGKEKYAEYNNIIWQIAAKYGAVVIDVLTPLSQNPGGYLT
ncbi:MAG TPA: GDSL-type esterase/lipase family protein, partial [Candidatus Humimicrobiaceae bacterium]|nr:GDSL-type esterase/lipase family protein [Candidatus Humimicrobiaceae bacterium]